MAKYLFFRYDTLPAPYNSQILNQTVTTLHIERYDGTVNQFIARISDSGYRFGNNGGGVNYDFSYIITLPVVHHCLLTPEYSSAPVYMAIFVEKHQDE